MHPHKEFIYQYRNVDADMCAAIRIAHNAALDAERNYKKSKQMSMHRNVARSPSRRCREKVARHSGDRHEPGALCELSILRLPAVVAENALRGVSPGDWLPVTLTRQS